MPSWNVTLHLLTLSLLGLGGYLLVLFKKATEAAVQTSAEEGAKAAIRELEWPKEFARELQKSRGLERQELRFKSYGALWKELRPLAIHDRAAINRQTAADLFQKLTDWYFSECGGLLLTPQARDFYFALQELLGISSGMPADWHADRSGTLDSEAYQAFRELLESRKATLALSVLDYFSTGSVDDWEGRGHELGIGWRTSIRNLGADWMNLTGGQRFVTLQQVGSKLRSSLAYDLESRER